MSEKIGIVDIGSNTVRLVIYEKLEGRSSYERIENIKVTARLRSYFDETGELVEEGIQLLLSTLRDFLQILTYYRVTNQQWVATASLRHAANQRTILERIRQEVGVQVRLLSDYEEAYYGFFAIDQSMNVLEGLTVDIGGGSTEITYFKDGEMLAYESLPFGALSLRLQFVEGEMLTDKERKAMKQYIENEMESLSWLHAKKVPLIAIGGSARNIGKLHQQMTEYPLDELHQYEMTLEQLKEIDRQIATHTLSELQKLEAIDKERADTLQPSLLVFKTICKYAETEQFIISSKGLRDGLLCEQEERPTASSPVLIHRSIRDLKERFYIGNQKEEQLLILSFQLFHAIDAIRNCFDSKDEETLNYAARIFNLGKKADAETSNTTFFLVSHYTLSGLTHKERIRLALVASYKNKRLFYQYVEPFIEWFTEEELQRLALLGAILKVAQTLDRTKRENVKQIKVNVTAPNEWTVVITHEEFIFPEKYHFNAQKKHLEKMLKVTIHSQFERI